MTEIPTTSTKKDLYKEFGWIIRQWRKVSQDNSLRVTVLNDKTIPRSSEDQKKFRSNYQFYQKIGERMLDLEPYFPVNEIGSVMITHLDKITASQFTAMIREFETQQFKKRAIVTNEQTIGANCGKNYSFLIKMQLT